MNKIKTVFIVGPTASGKTSLSIDIAKRFGGEIISADSMQIYKGIHIASAAPDIEEMRGVPHHLIEFLEPDIQFSVADYVKKSRECILDVHSRGKLPIVVGGTGLYISSLLDNTNFIEEEIDEALRKELENQFDKIGGEEMLKLLETFDKDSAQRLHPNNRRRIIRAFEVYKTTGKTITSQNLASHTEPSPYDACVIGLNFFNRETLYNRINKRVDIMLENGLLDEAECFYKSQYNKGAFQAIGHKELSSYLQGDTDLDNAVENLKMQTRRYAKRQLTWFRRDDRINWIYPDLQENASEFAIELIENFLKEE